MSEQVLGSGQVRSEVGPLPPIVSATFVRKTRAKLMRASVFNDVVNKI